MVAPKTIDLTSEQLKDVLSYEPENGLFFWRKPAMPQSRVVIGGVAGSLESCGYVHIRIGGKRAYAHRLAWLYMTGEWPEDQIDHINGVRSDNRWSNLRQVDQSANSQNQRRAQRSSKLGILGVSRQASGFRAEIRANGVRKYIGFYKSAEDAHHAYLEAKRILHQGNVI